MTVRRVAIFAVLVAAGACDESPGFTERELKILSNYTNLGKQSEASLVAGLDGAVELGQALYFDCNLSAPLPADSDLGLAGDTGTISCNTCHDLEQGGADARLGAPTSLGVGGFVGVNVPTVYNSGWRETWGWTAKHTSLRSQISVPLEMAPHALTRAEVAAYIEANYSDEYLALGLPFDGSNCEDSVGEDCVFSNVAEILEAYVRTLRSEDSRFDRHMNPKNRDVLTDEEIRGAKLFIGRASCNECHNGPTFSDDRHHNIGVSQIGGTWNEGVVITEGEHKMELGHFPTPTLRNVGKTAPYMHNGLTDGLWDVVDFYRFGGHDTGYPGTKSDLIQPLNLSEEDVDDIVAFLKSLDEIPDIDEETGRDLKLPPEIYDDTRTCR